MTKPVAIATVILVAAAVSALAQGGNPPPTPDSGLPTVLGETGTMYDGNNANLQLPPEQNVYWALLWAQPSASGNSGPASAVGTGAAGTSLGSTTGGGEH